MPIDRSSDRSAIVCWRGVGVEIIQAADDAMVIRIFLPSGQGLYLSNEQAVAAETRSASGQHYTLVALEAKCGGTSRARRGVAKTKIAAQAGTSANVEGGGRVAARARRKTAQVALAVPA